MISVTTFSPGASSSMLLVDNRIGSAELLAPLKALGLPVELTRLDFGDFALTGRGLKGRTLQIGIERKRLGDLVQSLRSGRLAGHQLPGLTGPDAIYDRSWLVVEGTWRPGSRGLVEVPGSGRWSKRWQVLPGSMNAAELNKALLTLELLGGLHVRTTADEAETARFLAVLYRWWTDKDLDQHTTHLQIRTIPSGPIALSRFREVLCRFPGLGRVASGAVEKHFGNLRRACNAGVQEWAGISVPTRQGGCKRLGKTATTIQEFIRGEE